MPTTMPQAQAVQDQIASRVAARLSDLWILAIRWLREIHTWIERSRQRAVLRELAEDDRHLLQDIGKSKAEALREAAKPFWQP